MKTSDTIRLCLRLIVIVTVVLSPTAGCWCQEQATASESFIDTLGVNVHLSYANSPYSNYKNVESALLTLGVRHIREGGSPPLDAQHIAELKRLAALGIHTDYMLDGNWYPVGAKGYPDAYGTTQLDPASVVRFFDSLSPAIESIEGPNESNGNKDFKYLGAGFPVGTIKFDRDLYTAAKSSPYTRNIPVVLSSVADVEGTANVYDHMNVVSLGPIDYIDWGNLHCYAGGEMPGYPGPWGPQSIDWQISALLGTASKPGIGFGKPIDVTETGYEYYPNQWGISERAGGLYIPRLVFEWGLRKVKRCLIYELYDEPNQQGSEAHYGLLRGDGTPKPAYTALANVIGILKDEGRQFAPGKLNFDLSAPSTVHHLLLEKSNGVYFLAVWNEIRSYQLSPSGGSDIDNPAVQASLTLPFRAKFNVFAPNDSSGQASSESYTAAQSPMSISLRVPDKVLLIEIDRDSPKSYRTN